ncbi:hypothetical protein MMC21_007981, partial [Puttea exsequens]|nr:hypothetical protein [Puttea exsequens]
ADDSDGGFYVKIRSTLKTIAEKCIISLTAAAEEDDFGDQGNGHAYIALVAIVGGPVTTALGFFTNKDDLVYDRTFGWTIDALKKIAAEDRQHTISTIFDGGGNGKHELLTNVVAGGPGLIRALLYQNDRWNESQ